MNESRDLQQRADVQAPAPARGDEAPTWVEANLRGLIYLTIVVVATGLSALILVLFAVFILWRSPKGVPKRSILLSRMFVALRIVAW